MHNLRKILKIGDLILVGVLSVAIGVSVFIFRMVHGQGETVSVYVDGKPIYRLPLATSTRVQVRGPLGVTDIDIKDGHVLVRKAPCPHKTCMKMGRIQRAGEVIVCVPNKIFIKIEGKSKIDLDGITM